MKTITYPILIIALLFISKLNAQVITLPLEVLGQSGYNEVVSFDISDPTDINKLYVKIHRPVFKDVSVNPQRGAKGSFRINNGSWIDISNSNATCFPNEQSYGGLNGTFHTVRMTFAIHGITKGSNKLEFKLNKTDGLSSGYRVLEFNLLRNGKKVLPDNIFKEDDPLKWQPPLPSSSDIAKGKDLWNNKVLVESPLGKDLLKAKCTSCHAADGRDLKYFNYSNWAIQERAKFHGMNDTEAKQIASYIRTLKVPAPKQARPWNPPYQPGKGIDSKPVEEWAAGAG